MKRTLDLSKPVWVYRNVRRKRDAPPLYSIMQGGRVVGHCHSLMLQNVRFVVREGGRQRVLREQRKNVHAFVVGHIVESCFGADMNGTFPVHISYNPYKYGYFFYGWDTPTRAGVTRVHGARGVILNERGVTACYLE